jgi:MFS family permease
MSEEQQPAVPPTRPASAQPPPIAYEAPGADRPASAAPTEAQLECEPPTIKVLDYSPAPPAHDPYAALRSPAYRLFSLGWMIAVIGNQATMAALGWEIFDRTGSKLALGWLAGVQVIPLVLLALPAGVLADRFDRRNLIAITAVLNALCSVGLALLSYRTGSIPWMFLLVAGSATVLTLGRPARAALLPNIVPASAFSNAVTWNASMYQIAAMTGPAIGGLLISTSMRRYGNQALPYLMDAASAIFYAALVFWIPRPSGVKLEKKSVHPLQQLSAGIKFVYQTKIILATLTLDLFAVLLGGAVYLLPVFAKDVLHVSATQFGWLRAADALGAFSMALLMAHLRPMQRAGRSMLLAVAIFGAATIVFAMSRSFWLSMFALVVVGASDNISVVVRHTLVQVLTPDHMRGRVSAVNNIFIGASNELGGLESGVTAAALTVLALRLGYDARQANVMGPTWSVLFGGIGTIATVLLTAWVFPGLRKYGPLQPPSGQPVLPPDETLKGRAGASAAAAAQST